MKEENNNSIPNDLMSVLIKTLLVHGAKHNNLVTNQLKQALDISGSQQKRKISRYIGYGAVDIERVLGCTEQRTTIIGCGEIKENECHEYNFPLPIGLSNKKVGRRMIVTLAWFSPINPEHRNLREAKLELKPSENWDKTPLTELQTICNFYKLPCFFMFSLTFCVLFENLKSLQTK